MRVFRPSQNACQTVSASEVNRVKAFPEQACDLRLSIFAPAPYYASLGLAGPHLSQVWLGINVHEHLANMPVQIFLAPEQERIDLVY